MDLPRFRKLSTTLRAAFGARVFKVGLWGGFSCPNRDGTLSTEGCLFCNPSSSKPGTHRPGMSLSEQLRLGMDYIRSRHRADKFIPYLMDYTTTYCSPAALEEMLDLLIAHEDVVGLALCTRPDCLGEDILDVLRSFAARTFLSVELGVQTSCDRTLEAINRCHDSRATEQAIEALARIGAMISAHVILGLPGEERRENLATASFLARSGVHAVKIQNLHGVQDTPLARMLAEGSYVPLCMDEYAGLAVDFLEHLPPEVVIQRLTGEGPRTLTVSPEWSINKLAVLNAVHAELTRRDSWQGKARGAVVEDLLSTVNIPGLGPVSSLREVIPADA